MHLRLFIFNYSLLLELSNRSCGNPGYCDCSAQLLRVPKLLCTRKSYCGQLDVFTPGYIPEPLQFILGLFLLLCFTGIAKCIFCVWLIILNFHYPLLLLLWTFEAISWNPFLQRNISSCIFTSSKINFTNWCSPSIHHPTSTLPCPSSLTWCPFL